MHGGRHVTGCARVGSCVLSDNRVYDEFGAWRRRFIEGLEDRLLESC